MRRNLLFLCVVFPRGLVAVVLMDTGRGGGGRSPRVKQTRLWLKMARRATKLLADLDFQDSQMSI